VEIYWPSALAPRLARTAETKWIPAYAGMTSGRAIFEGAERGIPLVSWGAKAKTDSSRRSVKSRGLSFPRRRESTFPNEVDSRLRGGDNDGDFHPYWRAEGPCNTQNDRLGHLLYFPGHAQPLIYSIGHVLATPRLRRPR